MALTLFDFDFDQKRSEEEVIGAFELLKQEFKKRGNYHCMNKNELPFPVRSLCYCFEERGWIKLEESRVYPRRDLLDFHTADEAIEGYQEAIEKLLNREKKCWYRDFLSVRNFFGPCEFESKEERARFYQLKHEITKEAAMALGLDHFLNVPTSRGTKMNRFSSKWEKKHVLPMIAKRVIPLSSYEDVEQFFQTYAFFCGRRDWVWGSTNSNIPAYPEYKTVMLTEFDIACLAEAKDEKTISLILSYTGGSWINQYSEKYKILYPVGWSYQKYQESLTCDDLEIIFADMERLDRLHGRSGK